MPTTTYSAKSAGTAIAPIELHSIRSRYLTAHERFLFSIQNKYDELAKYAQRKDASQFVIDKGNKEIKDAFAFLNEMEVLMNEALQVGKDQYLAKKITQLKQKCSSWHLNQ